MSNDPIVSIIMPVYNVEKYVETAIKSIIYQTFSQFELIVVNDCTPDHSMEIVRKYAADDQRIKIVRTPRNEGLASARNLGLQIAVGKYIMFVDSDDRLDKKAVQMLYDAAMKNQAQVVISGFYEVYCRKNETVRFTIPVCPSDHVYHSSIEIHKSVAKLDLSIVGRFAWTKFYKKELLDKFSLSFENKEPVEDFFFNLNVYDHAESMVTISNPLYFYYKRAWGKTLTNRYTANLFSLFKERFMRVLLFHKKWGVIEKDILQINYYVYLRHLVELMRKVISNRSIAFHKKRSIIRQILEDPETMMCIQNIEHPGVGYRIFILLIKNKAIISIYAFIKLFNLVKIHFPRVYNNLRSRKDV